MKRAWVVAAPLASLAGVAIHDLLQRRHALLRNFPVIGHGRYLVEAIGPELRQYIVAGQRRGAAVQPGPAPLGLRLGQAGEQLLRVRDRQRHRAHHRLPDHQARHVRAGGRRRPIARRRPGGVAALRQGPGRARGRQAAFRPDSVVNISGMSFGSLSGNGVEALNRGAALAGCLQNTGEGGLSVHHRHGGELVFQIGTAYFGCRDEQGRFDLARLKDLVAGAPVRALEVKLSQGAKPGLGGLLPGRQGVGGDRRRPGRARGQGLRQPVPPRRVLRRRQPPRLGGAAGRRDRPAGGHQVGRRRPRVLARPRRPDGHAPGGASTSSTSTAARAGPAPRR